VATTIVEYKPQDPAPIQQQDSAFVSDNGEINATFTKDASGQNVVEFASRGYSIKWIPREIKYIDPSLGLEDIIVSADQSSDLFVLRDYHARYDRHFPDVEEWFRVEGGKLKHYFSLRGDQRPPLSILDNPYLAVSGVLEYDPSLSVRSMGMTMSGAFQTSDPIALVDANGREVFILPAIVAWDQSSPPQVQRGMFFVEEVGQGRLAFSIGVPYSWLSSPDVMYPVVIDPTIVCSSTVAVQYGGGSSKSIIRIPGTNIVYAAILDHKNGSNYWMYSLYKSTDGGTTWGSEGWIPNTSATMSCSGAFMLYDPSIQRLFIMYNAGHPEFVVWKHDTGGWDQDIAINGAGWNYTSTFCFDAQGNIWALVGGTSSINPALVWIPKSNPTGYKVFTLSISKFNYPTILFDSNRNQLVVFGQSISATSTADIFTLSPDSWTNPTTVNMTGQKVGWLSTGGAMLVIAGILTSDGYLTVAWGGHATTTFHMEKYQTTSPFSKVSSYTVDATPGQITSGTDAVSIFSPNGVDVYGFYCGYNASGSATDVWMTAKNGGSWTNVTNANGSGGGPDHSISPGYMGATYNPGITTVDILFIPYGIPTTSVYYAQQQFNAPPNAPTNLAPTGGAAITSLTPTLSGTFSDPDSGNTMSAIQVQVYRSSDNALMWDSGKAPIITTPQNQNWSIQVPGSANLAWNVQYYWKAKTWDNSDVQGPWSANQVFLTERAPTVTITSPTQGQTVTTSSITAQLSYSQADNVAQGSYQFQLQDQNGNVLQDSGAIQGNNNQYTFNNLTNNTTYKIAAFATTRDGIQGAATVVTFNTAFTPPLAPVVSQPVVNPNTASVTLNWTNQSGVTAVAYNRVYKQAKGAWVLVADQLTDGTFTDYLVCNGCPTTYGVSAVGVNGVESTIASVTATPSFIGDWIYDPVTGKQFQFLINRAAYDMQWMEERQEFQTFGSKPMIRRGPLNARSGTLQALMIQYNSPLTPIQQLQAFEENYNLHNPVYLKTAAGEVIKVDLYGYKRQMPVEYLNNQAIGCSVQWTEIS
jgi:hypothetical protein